MKLDLVEIDRLSPRGLYRLADLRGFVYVLAAVIRAGIGSARQMRSYVFMLGRYTKILERQTRHNHNLKIKAWVLQCPARLAQVRAMIGEASIRAWIRRMRAAYFAPPVSTGDRRAKPADETCTGNPRPHKPFALATLAQVEALLPFRPRWPRNRSAHAFRLGPGFCGKGEILPARQTRRPEPVRFFPPELGAGRVEPQGGRGQMGVQQAKASYWGERGTRGETGANASGRAGPTDNTKEPKHGPAPPTRQQEQPP